MLTKILTIYFGIGLCVALVDTAIQQLTIDIINKKHWPLEVIKRYGNERSQKNLNKCVKMVNDPKYWTASTMIFGIVRAIVCWPSYFLKMIRAVVFGLTMFNKEDS